MQFNIKKKKKKCTDKMQNNTHKNKICTNQKKEQAKKNI